MKWIRLWTNEVVFGTTFQELNLETRGLWFSLLSMAGLPPTFGIVELRKGVPYDRRTLASLLNCSTKRLNKGIEVLASPEVAKIRLDNGFIHICNWQKYQTRYEKYYRNRHTEDLADTCQGEVEEDVDKKEEGEGTPCPYEKVLSDWNDFSQKHGLAQIRKLPQARRVKVRCRWTEWTAEGDAAETWGAILAKIAESAFLLGANDRRWKMDFDWLMANDTRWLKILEGAYTDGPGSGRKESEWTI